MAGEIRVRIFGPSRKNSISILCALALHVRPFIPVFLFGMVPPKQKRTLFILASGTQDVSEPGWSSKVCLCVCMSVCPSV